VGFNDPMILNEKVTA